MVSAPGERVGGRAVRQRLVDRRRARAVHRAVGLSATGSWRPAFIVTGLLGFLWIPLFRWLYRSPEEHPRLSPEERAGHPGEPRIVARPPATESYRTLLRLPQTWGIVIGKALTDPVWFFITDWFAIYLASRGFPLEDSLLAFWVPFMAADLGNFAGGGVSSVLIKRGWRVGLGAEDRHRRSARWACSS